MKKILLFTNVVTLLALGATWFSGCGGSGGSATPVNPIVFNPLAGKLSYPGSNPNYPVTFGQIDSIGMPVSPPVCTSFQTPDPDTRHYRLLAGDAIELVSQYSRDHWETINRSNADSSKDSRCIWFSLSRLKGFINYIEGRAANIGVANCCDSLGIRIYFGEYDATLQDKFFPLAKNYRYKTTLMMVPTLASGGINWDFNPDYYGSPSDFVCGNFMHDSAWNGTIVALTMNHGGAVPPPWPSNSCADYKNSGANFMLYKLDPYWLNNRYFYFLPSASNQTCEDLHTP